MDLESSCLPGKEFRCGGQIFPATVHQLEEAFASVDANYFLSCGNRVLQLVYDGRKWAFGLLYDVSDTCREALCQSRSFTDDVVPLLWSAFRR